MIDDGLKWFLEAGGEPLTVYPVFSGQNVYTRFFERKQRSCVVVTWKTLTSLAQPFFREYFML